MRLALTKMREARCLTWRGWLAVVMLPTLAVIVGMKLCVPFLSLNHPIPAEALVVEGWLPDYALKDVVKEFRNGNYHYIITAGSPLLGGYYLSDLKTSADMAAASLVKFGIASSLVVPVPGPAVFRDRSLAHARAVRDWVELHDPNLRSINVYSLGVHTRRTRLDFEQAFGKGVKVGAIAHTDEAYDSDHWWTTSEGFRTVTGEVLAYIWTRLRAKP